MKLVTAKCPNCGAQIEVDEYSNTTRCDYCGSQILVEEAIEKYKVEISGSIEIENLPKLENYLKLADRHYCNEEYKDAYDIYSKAIELDPDNYIVILRKALTKALCSNYKKLELVPVLNAIKNSYSILEKRDERDKLNDLVVESNNAVCKLEEHVISIYRNNLLNHDEVTIYIQRLKDCLAIYEFLSAIITDNDDLRIILMQNSVSTINSLLESKRCLTGRFNQNGSPVTAYYRMDYSLKESLLDKKRSYVTECATLKKNTYEKKLENNKAIQLNIKNLNNNSCTGKTSNNVQKVLCYVMFAISLVIAVAYFRSGVSMLVGFVCLLLAIVFLPQIKEEVTNKNETYGGLIIAARIGLVLLAFYVIVNTASSRCFDNTWISDNGMQVILKNDDATVVLQDGTKLEGKYIYNWTNPGYDIYVHITSNNQEYHFFYIEDNKKVKFYLVDENNNAIYFIPKQPKSSYEYLKE